MRVLITGWPSFWHGEATAGDVAAMDRVAAGLATAGIPHDIAWSPVLHPRGLTLDDAAPRNYTDLVFVCGPVHGRQVEELHERYAHCHRVAIGCSVIDPHSAAYTGFHAVAPRDSPGSPPRRDLASAVPPGGAPVAAVVLSPGQREYGSDRRHDVVHRQVLEWINEITCAPMVVDTRLDSHNGRMCSSVEEVAALLARADVVITSRVHGLVFALVQGIPALALDTIAGGGKVSAQAAAWDWPAVLPAEDMQGSAEHARSLLDRWWNWCCGPDATALAQARAAEAPAAGRREMSWLLDELRIRAWTGERS